MCSDYVSMCVCKCMGVCLSCSFMDIHLDECDGVPPRLPLKKGDIKNDATPLLENKGALPAALSSVEC